MTRADRIDWALHLAMTAMPAKLCSALGARLAPLMGRKANPAADRSAAALLAAVGSQGKTDPIAIEAALNRLWDNAGRTFAEFAVSHRLLRAGRVAVVGQHHLDRALASGRPIIGLFVHTGNWEISEMQMAYLAPDRVVVVIDPPKRASRAAIAAKVRSIAPFRELAPMSTMVWRRGLKQLETPGGIFLVAADEAVNGHIGAPFFGRPLRTDGNLGKAARLALRTNAIVLPFFNERHPGPRFSTHILPPLEFSGDARDEAAIRGVVSALDAALTPEVLRLLDQWFSALLYSSAAPDGWG